MPLPQPTEAERLAAIADIETLIAQPINSWNLADAKKLLAALLVWFRANGW